MQFSLFSLFFRRNQAVSEKNVCGTSHITGCSFSIYPMSDNFVEIITSSLRNVNTSKVWMDTDDVSTTVRGRTSHVFDVVKAIFVEAAKTGKHVVLNATFAIGCPGDIDADVYMAEDDTKLNEPNSSLVSIETATKFALYPLGISTYIDIIMDQIHIAQEQGTFTKGTHYATRLDGNVHDVFKTLEDSFHNAQTSESSHVVMTVTMSANSPSKKEIK
jgi:energy-coupling factor transport system substrate-specific component